MAITQLSSVAVDQAAYDRNVYFALRAELYFDQVADVMPTAQSMPGTSVVFDQWTDLAAATTPLTETSDITPATMSDAQVTVTLVEYGNAVQTTAKLRGTAYVDVDRVGANVIGYNAGLSIDEVAAQVLVAGTNVSYSGAATSRVTVAAGHTLSGPNAARGAAMLRSRNVPTFNGYYAAFIHPLVSYDLRQTTGAAAWQDPHAYSAPENIWAGEIGAFQGSRWVETPRAPVFADAGVGGTVDVYTTTFVGRQSLAKAWSVQDGNGPQPQVVRGPVTDMLRRFEPIGWYWLGGYSRFREASIQRNESSSSLGTN